MQGSCNCGLVRFTIKGPLPGLYQCHCSLCQKQSGTASNAGTLVKSGNFVWNSGSEHIKKWHKSTGFSSHFCSECGSPVPNLFKDYMWVPVGLITDAKARVVAHICVDDKPDWVIPQTAERSYPGMPDDIGEFLAFLYANSNS